MRPRHLLLLALSLLAACTSTQPVAAPAPVEGGACAPVETVEIQGGAHLLGDREPPVPYNSTPPTSGWHASGPPAIGIRDAADALTEPEQVSVLEAGGAVVTYRDLDDADRATLEQIVLRDFPGRVAVTPYEGLEAGEVAFTAWGTLQRCEELDTAALAAFVATYADEELHTSGHH